MNLKVTRHDRHLQNKAHMLKYFRYLFSLRSPMLFLLLSVSVMVMGEYPLKTMSVKGYMLKSISRVVYAVELPTSQANH